MAKAVFYGAVSLDGYLARPNHSLDWLLESEPAVSSYESFYQTVDMVVMGRVTYDQVLLLSPGRWPYLEKPSFIFSRTPRPSLPNITFIATDATEFIHHLKSQSDGTIWVVGGGNLITSLRKSQLIDEYILQIVPHIIGEGIPLFHSAPFEDRLELLDIHRYEQFAELRYRSLSDT